MYSYDAQEAFGSWCVRGAGAEKPVPIWRAARDYSEEEQGFITYLLRYSDRELLDILKNVQDPRRQSMIQKVYEYKRWKRAHHG